MTFPIVSSTAKGGGISSNGRDLTAALNCRAKKQEIPKESSGDFAICRGNVTKSPLWVTTIDFFVGWVYSPTVRVTRQIGGRVHPPYTVLRISRRVHANGYLESGVVGTTLFVQLKPGHQFRGQLVVRVPLQGFAITLNGFIRAPKFFKHIATHTKTKCIRGFSST